MPRQRKRSKSGRKRLDTLKRSDVKRGRPRKVNLLELYSLTRYYGDIKRAAAELGVSLSYAQKVYNKEKRRRKMELAAEKEERAKQQEKHRNSKSYLALLDADVWKIPNSNSVLVSNK